MSKTIESDDAIPRSDGTVLSFIGQNAENDFPVLKAFQQYIDAEQAKARKRMLGLSIFFIMLLVAVVVTFTIVMMSVINRNQTLSDRLLEIALRERPAQAAPVVVQQPAPQPIVQPAPVHSRESELKPFLDKMETLVSAIVAKQQQQSIAPAPVVVTTGTPMQTLQPSTESVEAARMREELKKQKEELEAERARLKEAQEKLKQAEIEKHRRRLYPEYYAQEEARKMAPVPAPAPAPVTPPPQVVAPPVAAVAAPAPAPVAPAQSEPKARPAAPAPAPARVRTSLENLKPINYFELSDDTPPAKPATKPAQKPDPKPTPAAKTSAPAAKPAATAPAAKPATPAAKPVAKPAEKPAPKPAAKPAAPKPPPPSQPPVKKTEAPKTETIDVGTPSGNATPWLIEQQDL